MFSGYRLFLLLFSAHALWAGRTAFQICSGADNLPYSNMKGEGFENKLADLVARDLGRPYRYVWLGPKASELSNHIADGSCDLVMGIASSVTYLATTKPYYRSTYVWVSRHDRHLTVRSVDDPALKTFTIGVHYLGEDNSEIPPLQALGKRGLMKNIIGFRIQGNYAKHDQGGMLIQAVADRKVDIAMAWGPLGGYFARHAAVPLDVQPISPDHDGPFLPFSFDISMGVKRGDVTLQNALNRFIDRRQEEIYALLEKFGVPRVARS